MTILRYTLLSDGSSDRALIPILNWILIQNGVGAIQPSWADLGRLRNPPQSLSERIRLSVDFYPCDILFVHRDAEGESRQSRTMEIGNGYRDGSGKQSFPPYICVVPVRMTEAWLLFSEEAIRYASGNSSGRTPLELPRVNELESLPDPKRVLYDLLLQSSELTGRRRKTFRTPQRIHRISEFVNDFTPLRRLDAFSALEQDVQALLVSLTTH